MNQPLPPPKKTAAMRRKQKMLSGSTLLEHNTDIPENPHRETQPRRGGAMAVKQRQLGSSPFAADAPTRQMGSNRSQRSSRQKQQMLQGHISNDMQTHQEAKRHSAKAQRHNSKNRESAQNPFSHEAAPARRRSGRGQRKIVSHANHEASADSPWGNMEEPNHVMSSDGKYLGRLGGAGQVSMVSPDTPWQTGGNFQGTTTNQSQFQAREAPKNLPRAGMPRRGRRSKSRHSRRSVGDTTVASNGQRRAGAPSHRSNNRPRAKSRSSRTYTLSKDSPFG